MMWILGGVREWRLEHALAGMIYLCLFYALGCFVWLSFLFVLMRCSWPLFEGHSILMRSTVGLLAKFWLGPAV